MISRELLALVCNNTDDWLEPVQHTCDRFQIDTPLRIAGFLSQVAHESGDFKFTTENLNYSAAALRSIFGKYFTDDSQANAYARQPEKIANRVYANRMGNGNEASGEGWKYRGRGLIQLTGKDNYVAFGNSTATDSANNPDSVAAPDAAVLSAGWFWNSRHLNNYADAGDVLGMTKRINGGTNGLDDRQAKYDKLMSYFNNQ